MWCFWVSAPHSSQTDGCLYVRLHASVCFRWHTVTACHHFRPKRQQTSDKHEACWDHTHTHRWHEDQNSEGSFISRSFILLGQMNERLGLDGTRKRWNNMYLFNMYLPLFHGTTSNWIVDSKAISWTDVGYSFVISTLIKHVKGLELILRVPFAFGSCCCEPHHMVKGSLHTSETDDC